MSSLDIMHITVSPALYAVGEIWILWNLLSCFKQRFSRRITIVLAAVYALLYLLGEAIANLHYFDSDYSVAQNVIMTATALICAAIPFFMLKEKWYKTFGIYCLYGMLIALPKMAGTAVGALLGMDLTELSKTSLMFTFYGPDFTILLAPLINFIVKRLFSGAPYGKRESAAFSVFLILQFVAGLTFYTHYRPFIVSAESYDPTSTVLLIFGGFFVPDMLLLFLLRRITRLRLIEMENARLLAEMQSQTQYYELLGESQASLRQVMHDYANHIETIKYLKSQAKNEEAQGYIDALSTEYESLHQVYTGVSVIDALLNVKKKQCAGQQVELDLRVSALSRMDSTMSMDMTLALANLLDNALRGAADAADEASRPKTISVVASKKANVLKVLASNPCRETLLAPNLSTTKPNAPEHGFGLSILRSIAKKYAGSCTFAVQNNHFTATLILVEPGD